MKLNDSRRTVVSFITSIHIYSKNRIEITFRYREEYAKAIMALEDMKEAV
ncbi:MAG: hypothetical protein IJG16_10105 [Clostridia bacterium]|nr:hypothetical protein [Clostridia bacterium]